MPDNSMRGGCCFAGDSNSFVSKRNGRVYIESLKVGDEVMVIFGNGEVGYSEIWCLAHQNADTETTFQELETESRRLHVSPRHYVIILKDEIWKNVQAHKVEVDDVLVICDEEGTVTTEKVTANITIEGKGVYAPFTKEGTLLVNGVMVSCYADIKPEIAHKALAPFRVLYDVTPSVVMDTLMTPNTAGVPGVLGAAHMLTSPFLME